MDDDPSLFTLRQIQMALGLKYPVLAQRKLGGLAASTTIISERGKPVAAWRFGSLPESIRSELEGQRKRRMLRSVRELLLNPPRRYEHPLKPTPEQILEAEKIRDVLAPILQRREGEKSSTAGMARMARDRFADLRSFSKPPPAETVEDWIRTAIHRDNEWLHFGEVELYLSEARLQAEMPEAAPVSVDLVAEFLSTCDENSLDPKKEAALWEICFSNYGVLCKAGTKPKTARDAIVCRLRAPEAPFHRLSLAAVEKRWNRKLDLWENDGRSREAVMDGRSISTGRKPKFTLTADEKNGLKLLVLEKGSAAMGIEFFAESPECRQETRKLIQDELSRAAARKRHPSWPDSLRKAAHVTEEEKASFRGRKHLSKVEHMEPRGLDWIDESGSPQALLPNHIWESDDMSLNEPFSWGDSENGETRIGRQTLCTQDVYSRFWLGHTLLGRARDAYRMEDIADHMLECVELHGLPLAWRLERGVWENSFIDGIKIGEDDGKAILWGGLGAIINIVRTFKSRGKGGIESSFNLLQNIIAHESTHIGRSRGEFETPAKLYLAATDPKASREKREKAAAKFWTMDAASAGMAAAMERFNGRPKKRRQFGRDLVVPADLFHGAERRELPVSEAWRFLPVKMMGTIRQGHFETVAPHYPLAFRFAVNGVKDGLYLQHGYPILAAFHPGRPDQGCHIFNFETGPRNRENWKVGELLTIAPMAEDAPQIVIAPQDREMFRRKNANAAMRSVFRGIVGAGRQNNGRNTARDGWGNRGQVSNRPEGPAPATEKTQSRTKGDDLIEQAALKRTIELESELLRTGRLTPIHE